MLQNSIVTRTHNLGCIGGYSNCEVDELCVVYDCVIVLLCYHLFCVCLCHKILALAILCCTSLRCIALRWHLQCWLDSASASPPQAGKRCAASWVASNLGSKGKALVMSKGCWKALRAKVGNFRRRPIGWPQSRTFAGADNCDTIMF